MIIDCRTKEGCELAVRNRWRCFLNGKEIRLVWYVDTEGGFIRTLDVLGDGEPHPVRRGFGTVCYQTSDFRGRDVQAPLDGVLSETLYGHIELRPPDEPAEDVSARAR